MSAVAKGRCACLFRELNSPFPIDVSALPDGFRIVRGSYPRENLQKPGQELATVSILL